MTDYTTMSYNKIKDLAKEKGFEGNNAKRADLIAFLSSLETPTVAETIDATAEALETAGEPVSTAEIVEAAKEAETAPETKTETKTETEAKAEEKKEKKSDKVRARRAEVAEVVKEIFAENSIAMNWGTVVQKYEAKKNLKHDAVLWHDIGHGINALVTAGTVKVYNPDKGRTTYQAVVTE